MRKICLACRAPITRIVPLPPGGHIGLPEPEYCFDCAGVVDLVVAAAPKKGRPWLRLMLRTLFRRVELLEEERTIRAEFRKRKAELARR